MRIIQHKREAYWFYRFLSIFYDEYVNPLFWTPQMRTEALQLAELNSADLKILETGSGTGFTTLGIVENVRAANIFCVDQSPHQMAKAKQKGELDGCTFQIGDAENLTFLDNHFDRYVSAGSIEYWPDPQRAITEAFRVLKPGGVALVIGPLEPRNWFAKRLADAWMLFPRESEYSDWFEKAGFEQINKKYIRPEWVESEDYGIAISGVKANHSGKPLNSNPLSKGEAEEQSPVLRMMILVGRLFVGAVSGFLFILIALGGHLRRFLKTGMKARRK
jgi:MPBQ/MSBQ methyltransferase